MEKLADATSEIYPLPPIGHAEWPGVAHHEAGHAVAEIVIRRALDNPPPPFHRVLIRPGATGPCEAHGNIVGMVDRQTSFVPALRKSTPTDCTLAEYEILARMAGPFAEAMYICRLYGTPDEVYVADTARNVCRIGGSERDFEHAENIHRELCILARRKIQLKRLKSRTYQLVRDNWPAICALADRLLTKHELTYDEALAVVRPFLLPAGQGGGLRSRPFSISHYR